MTQPFPRDPEAKKRLHRDMVAVAPSLMAEVAEIKKLFPKARLTHFKGGGMEYGTPSKPGWEIPADIDTAAIEAERKLAMKREQKRIERNKARRATR